MFGLPADTDLTFLLERVLVQICFGENDVFLNFDNPISIRIESSITLVEASGESRFFDNLLEVVPHLRSLLGEQVRAAHVVASGTLVLEFSSGTQVKIHDDSQQFESYSVHHPGGVIIV
jgi:hypothetical protein